MDRPAGVVVVSLGFFSISAFFMLFAALGLLAQAITHPRDILIMLPGLIFYLFIIAIPGAIGWGLWNLENTARVASLLTMGAVALIGVAFITRIGVISFFGALYYSYLFVTGTAAFYLNRKIVKAAFEKEISSIHFKDL